MRNWRWNVKLKSLLYDVGNPCSHQITAFQQEARLHFFWPRLIFVDREYQSAFCLPMYHKQRGCFLATSGSHVTVSKYSGPKVSSSLRVTSVILSLFVVSASARRSNPAAVHHNKVSSTDIYWGFYTDIYTDIYRDYLDTWLLMVISYRWWLV